MAMTYDNRIPTGPGGGASAVEAGSVLEQLSSKVSRASDIADRLRSKMDYVDGSLPEAATNGVGPTNGFLEELNQWLALVLNRIEGDVRRLERIVG